MTEENGFWDKLVRYGYEHEWFDATSPYPPQGQIPHFTAEGEREVDFGTTLCSMGMSKNGLMLHLQSKYEGAGTGGVFRHRHQIHHTGVQKH